LVQICFFNIYTYCIIWLHHINLYHLMQPCTVFSLTSVKFIVLILDSLLQAWC
jgi:hypothetical protein